MSCIDQDGYFFYSRKPNAPHYIYDKMVGGLVDMYLYAGSKDALKALARITDWAIAHLDRRNIYAFNAGEGPTEWYTLSENLYRAFLATGDSRYRDFAKVWEYTAYWDLYAQGGDLFGKRPDGGQTRGYHAYSHVNTLGGAGAAYPRDRRAKVPRTFSRVHTTLCKRTSASPPEATDPMSSCSAKLIWPGISRTRTTASRRSAAAGPASSSAST